MYRFKTISDAYSEARKYNKYETTAPFPPYVTIELLNRCNFKCRMCSRTFQNEAEMHFPLMKLKKVIDEIAEYGSMVRFIGFCEPLMYKHVKEAVSYVKGKGLLLHITTNASLLDRETADFLAGAGLDSIIFSFQGGSDDEYMQMRSLKPAVYEKVLENIGYFRSVQKGTAMKLSTTLTERDKQEDVDQFVKKLSQYVDEVQISGFTHFVHVSDLFGEEGVWDELGISRPDLKDGVRCFLPNFEMLIKADGSACACCGAYTDSLTYGDAFTESLMDIWRGGQAEKLRTMICGGQLSEIENCSVCPIRYKYDSIDNSVFNTRK